jgi:hypothetical protein
VLNPLAFALNNLALAGAARAAIARLVGFASDSFPLWVEIARPLVPWVFGLIWQLPLHAGLRLGGSRRRLRTTIGASFYAGGPIGIVTLLALPLHLRAMSSTSPPLLLANAAGGLITLVLSLAFLTATHAGAHGLSRRRALLPVLFITLGAAACGAWMGMHSPPWAHKMLSVLLF